MAHSTSMEDYKYSLSFTYGIVICLGLAALVGLVGNVLLVVVITQARKLRSVMNRFILHLAIGDLIVCIICIPLFLAINFYPEKSKYVVMCKLARFLQYLAPQATIMLLITIGINRHQAIVHPLRGMEYRTANKLICGAWLYSLIVVAPSIYLTNIKYYTIGPLNATKAYCATIPVSTKLGLSYVLGLAFLGYILPLISLLVLYGKISCAVWRRNSGELRTSRPAAAMLRSRKKVIKMFLTVILVFVVTWLPLIIYVGVLESYLGGPKRISYARLSLYAIGLSNSTYNPFIYSFFNKKFRDGCKSIFKESARMMGYKKSGERREALRAKRNPYIVPETTKQTANDNQEDWKEKFNCQAVRVHLDGNGHESKDDVKLLTIKETTEHDVDSNSDASSHCTNVSVTPVHRPNPEKEQQEFNNIAVLENTPKHGINAKARDKKFKFKSLSVDQSWLRSRENSKKAKKLRKTVSNDDTRWSNDFENIF